MSGQSAPPARPSWATASGALKQVGELFDPVEAWFKPVHRFCLSCRVGVGEKHREGCPRAICACNGLKLTRCNSSYFGNRWSESDDEEQFATCRECAGGLPYDGYEFSDEPTAFNLGVAFTRTISVPATLDTEGKINHGKLDTRCVEPEVYGAKPHFMDVDMLRKTGAIVWSRPRLRWEWAPFVTASRLTTSQMLVRCLLLSTRGRAAPRAYESNAANDATAGDALGTGFATAAEVLVAQSAPPAQGGPARDDDKNGGATVVPVPDGIRMMHRLVSSGHGVLAGKVLQFFKGELRPWFYGMHYQDALMMGMRGGRVVADY